MLHGTAPPFMHLNVPANNPPSVVSIAAMPLPAAPNDSPGNVVPTAALPTADSKKLQPSQLQSPAGFCYCSTCLAALVYKAEMLDSTHLPALLDAAMLTFSVSTMHVHNGDGTAL
jgi:hypothetical protein